MESVVEILTKWANSVELKNKINWITCEDGLKLTELVWVCTIGDISVEKAKLEDAVRECDRLVTIESEKYLKTLKVG